VQLVVPAGPPRRLLSAVRPRPRGRAGRGRGGAGTRPTPRPTVWRGRPSG